MAVSGGGDSVALLLLLVEALRQGGQDPASLLVVAHLDHGLRAGSGSDADLVGELAAEQGLELRTRRLQGPEIEVIRSDPRGLQAGARDVRRNQLEAWAEEARATRIAFGHTRDDLAETLVLALLRGGGSGALAGMRTEGPGRAWRPLLGISREALREFLGGRGARFHEDPSNHSARFDRVRVRQEVLPLLESIRPGAVGVLARVAGLLGADGEALDDLARDWLEARSRVSPQGDLELPAGDLAGLADAIGSRVVRKALEEVSGWRGDSRTVARIGNLARRPRPGARLELPRGIRVEGGLWLRIGRDPAPGEVGTQGFRIPLGELQPGGPAHQGRVLGRSLEFRLMVGSGASPGSSEGNRERLWIPLAELVDPVVVRPPRDGDRFQPASLRGGSKRLARYLRDRGRDRRARARTLVVEDRQGIAGVVGFEARFHAAGDPSGPWLLLEVASALE